MRARLNLRRPGLVAVLAWRRRVVFMLTGMAAFRILHRMVETVW